MKEYFKNVDKKYIISLIICIVAALLFGALLMLVTGFNPIEGYSAMIFGAVGNARLLEINLVHGLQDIFTEIYKHCIG